jgi:hypothetical protein
MEAKQAMPQAQPINWRGWGKRGECRNCGARSTIRVIWVSQIRREARTDTPYAAWNHPAERWSVADEACLDTDACEARKKRAYEQRSRRSGTLRWVQSRFEAPGLDLPKGTCRWCGEQIVYTADADYRVKSRQRHRGDEHEVGDRDCRREHNRSYAFSGRELVQLRGDPCCVWCGQAEVWVEDPNSEFRDGWWHNGDWEADHVVPLEDGGAHCPTNIARCCCDCHKAKTARENAARREARRVDKAQAAA